MPASTQSKGACAYCGHETTRGHMARHLAACPARRKAAAIAGSGLGTPATFVHLQARDSISGEYWLHLEVDGTATLKQIDKYLRAIWLECCGHLSKFTAGGWRGDEVAMTRKAASVFVPGAELEHIYDFGTESVTYLKTVDAREGKRTSKHPIALMARNHAPRYECQECGAPAAYLCMECVYEDDAAGTLCADHGKDHPHEDYGGPIELVNSPRIGMCGYTGPADPPY
ncbi:MAG TPA: hypothetical protein VFS20_07865 [Longimicrobium sp.]|nr:hypothetical protein [Longimicrobium sp.]